MAGDILEGAPLLHTGWAVEAASDPAPGYAVQWFAGLSAPGFFLRQSTLEVLQPNESAIALFTSGRGLARINDRLALPGKGVADRFRNALGRIAAGPAAFPFMFENEGFGILRIERVSGSDILSVLVFPPSPTSDIWVDTGEIFGMTPAEDRLIKRLMSGATLAEVSDELGISIETARTHVRRAYLKIGVNNREQLFAALAPFRLRA